MLKNENFNVKNNKIKIPLIERIIICGISKNNLNEIQTPISSDEKLTIESLSNLDIEILEEYTSSLLNDEQKKNNSYILNIPKYSLPLGSSPKIIKNKSNAKYENDKQIISFTLVQDTKLKHCSSLSFYDNYKLNSKDILLKKSITLISSKDYYAIHKDILDYIYKIIINYYLYKNKNINQLQKIYYENYFSHEKIYIPEYAILSFYFSFLLNAWDINPMNNKMLKSFFVLPFKSENKNKINENNNINKDFLFKIYIDDKSVFPIKDYDLTFLLNIFHIEDLIILYQGLLMEFEIILIFNNFENINIIIHSLLSLIYPLKWKFPITSFLLPETEVMLDAPFATIIGVHESFKYLIEYKIKKECFNLETTLIYDLFEKKFILKDPNFPLMQSILLNNIKSGLYFLKAEMYQFKYGTIKINNGLMKLFDKKENIVNKIDNKIYLNMKMISIFFNAFINLIKNIKSCIKYDYIEKNQININTCEPNDFFDFNKFQNYSNKDYSYINNNNDNNFLQNFSKTLMFSYFIRSFIKYQNTKKIFIFINDILTKLSEKELINQHKYLNDSYDKNIRNNLMNYYLIKYINLDTLLSNYFMKGINPNEIFIINDLSKTTNEIWNSIDQKKIKSFSDNIFNTYYSNMILNSKIGESLIDSINLIGINSAITNNNINDLYNKKIKENEEIYNLIKSFIEEKIVNKNNNNINIRNTMHHRSNSSMNEKIFQQQKFDLNLNYPNNNNINNNKKIEKSDIIISSVNTYSKEHMSNSNTNKKKINQKQKMMKPLRNNYNSLTNVIHGVMAKHAGDEDDIINIPDDF